jgi:large subunit ribosomal protein L13
LLKSQKKRKKQKEGGRVKRKGERRTKLHPLPLTLMKMTQPTKTSDITREWVLVDVKDQILGRVATQIAQLLMGKSKAYFAKNMDCGDHVVVINAKYVKATGNKEDQKVYTRYSGYPGGLRSETLKELRIRKPEEIILHAVSGMLPKNKLRDTMLARLHVFAEAEHKYEDKLTSGKGEA